MLTTGRLLFSLIAGHLAATTLAAELPYLVSFKPRSTFGHDAVVSTPLFPGARFAGPPISCTGTPGRKTELPAIRKVIMSPEVAEELRRHPDVEKVEHVEDGRLGVLTSQTDLRYPSSYPLPRISHTVPNATKYAYDSSAGNGTCIFVLDSGFTPHSDFNGRIYNAGSFFDNQTLNTLTQGRDEVGHGTHVAGTGECHQFNVR
jgi:subtilisin family serine protease